MTGKTHYANGQKIFEQIGDTLTYYFKDGLVKARGPSIDGKMEGEWLFYRERGQLWQVGQFRHDQKHGPWVRYGRDGQVEYDETFENGKLVKKKT